MHIPRLPVFRVTIAVIVAAAPARGQQMTAPAWGALTRLVGTWVADSGSGGKPGVAIRGGEAWSRDLDGRVLVRRDYSEYAATPARAAFRHEGLTVISPAPDGGMVAHTYDSEGHVIDYVVAVTDTVIVFTSPPTASTPQFRLTYRPRGTGYAVTFEIAPPGRAGQFQRYVAGSLRRAP